MITRFAPSPTGPLHLGHAYSALLAHDMAQAAGGTFLLRIEDIDQSRSRTDWEEQIYHDLRWLGLTWTTPVMRQSDRLAAYQEVLTQMRWDGLLYACTCNRRDIIAAATAPQEGDVTYGPDGVFILGHAATRLLTAIIIPQEFPSTKHFAWIGQPFPRARLTAHLSLKQETDPNAQFLCH